MIQKNIKNNMQPNNNVKYYRTIRLKKQTNERRKQKKIFWEINKRKIKK